MRTIFSVFLATLCSWAQAQTGARVTELVVPSSINNATVLGVANNSTETYLVVKDDQAPSGAAIWYMPKGGTFTKVDLSKVVGRLYRTSPFFLAQPLKIDAGGLWFLDHNPTGTCGGSYRVRKGVLEVLGIPGQDIMFSPYQRGAVSAKVVCLGVGNVFGSTEETQFLLTAKDSRGVSYRSFVRKIGNTYGTLLPVSIAEEPLGYPYPYALTQTEVKWGVWGGEDGVIRFLEFDPISGRQVMSQFDLSKRVLTRLLDLSGRSLVLGIDPATGERWYRMGSEIYAFPSQLNKAELLATLPKAKAFEGAFQILGSGAGSLRMLPVGLLNREAGTSISYDAMGVYDGEAVRPVLLKGQTLPNGKFVKNLNVSDVSNEIRFSSAGCEMIVPTYVSKGGTMDMLLKVEIPCITKAPTVVTEGNSVTLEGTGFTTPGMKTEVRLGGIGFTPPFDLTSTTLKFTTSPLCSGLCPVQVIAGEYASNVVKIQVNRAPIPEPVVGAVTDLNGGRKNASPGKLMTLWGTELCSIRTQIAIIPQESPIIGGVLRDDSTSGCKVLVDGSPVGIYFGWTGLDSVSQINFLVPYGINPGDHELIVQKTEVRNGATSVVAVSKPFVLKVEDVNPTFFKPQAYPVTLVKSDRTYVSADNPAMPGDVLVVYLSGGGKTAPSLPERQAGVARFLQEVRVKVNGVECPVYYAGTQPQFPGLEQVNLQVPEGVTPQENMATLTIKIGNSTAEFSIHLKR